MTKTVNKLDDFAQSLAQAMIKFRWLIILASLGLAVSVSMGASKLEFSNNYRTFFSKDNPDLRTFEEFQSTYTKNDNLLFVLEPKDGASVFTNQTLAAVEQLTEAAWRVPFALRVDSLSNFQHTEAIGDDLIVEDLVYDALSLSEAALAEKRAIALAEPLLINALVTKDGTVTGVNVVLQYPEKSLTEVPQAVAFSRELKAQIESDFPHLNIYLTGTSELNNAFAESAQKDFGFLVPVMFAVILVATAVAVRSVSATFSTLLIIVFSCMIAMGLAGHISIKLAGPSPSAVIIIMTLAIADSIHILMSMRQAMRDGMKKHAAIVEAVRINFLAVSVTSITTIVGFLCLHFSDSPPFRDLGTITAFGIVGAWLFSLTLLPALLSLTPIRVKPRPADQARSGLMLGLANFVIKHARALMLVTGLASAALIVQIPNIAFSDQWREYFAPSVTFRDQTDKVLPYFGLYPIEFSVPASDAGGVSDPDFLQKLEDYTEWLRAQEGVTHVYSIVDIMKRLNKNLNGDDESFYRLPDNRELSAQYLLLYELSLPYGLDLNDRINIDKSATRVTATMSGAVSTKRVREFLADSQAWFAENAPEMSAPPTGAQVMFTFITQRNVNAMLTGTTIAIFAIAIIMTLTLRSVKMGVLSLAPNALPILSAFGVWALLRGEIGFSVSVIAAISLGIVIDDTVHFLTKFVRARREKALTAADSVRYAFDTVGIALTVNTFILAAGFLMLTFSTFKINEEMGLMTSLTIVLALVLDFLLLPALLLFTLGRGESKEPAPLPPAQAQFAE